MEITANAVQTVLSNQDVLYTETAVTGNNCSILHRQGSGLVTLRGLTSQCRARFKAYFFGNVAVPADGTAGPVSLAFSLNGEPIASTTMTSTPTAVSAFNNVSDMIYIDVPKGCCSQIAVRNVGTTAIQVKNANLIVERVA